MYFPFLFKINSNLNTKLADGHLRITWAQDLSSGIYYLRFFINNVETAAINQGTIIRPLQLYTFQQTSNSYITDASVRCYVHQGILITHIVFRTVAEIPAWSNITIGKLLNWTYGERETICMALSVYGSISSAMRVSIDDKGNIIAATHGTMDAASVWFYGNGSIVL